MTSELVVDVQPKEVSIALLEDKSLVELQSEGRNISFSVGNMYLGRVKKLMPGLNACFVDVGYEKDAFLHYLDLGPQFNSLEKYVKQTLSDKKKLNPITKATILPDLEKDGTFAGQEQHCFRLLYVSGQNADVRTPAVRRDEKAADPSAQSGCHDREF